MKKTLTINISGSIFHIDEDAFEKLQSYLHSINAHYGSSEEGREIIVDIEARISELFQEKLSTKDQVVNVEMVETVITIMGKPEEIFETDEDHMESEPKTDDLFSAPKKKRRRLYRDPEKRVFGGVCSGLAAYFGIDVVVIRLIFVGLVLFPFVFTSGFGILLYFILWIVVPKALTTAQKLEMRGKKVNISNIEESIKDEYQDVKKNFEKMKDKSSPHIRDGFDKAIDFLGSVLRLLLKIIIILLGIGFVFAGFVSLISFIGSMIFAHSFFGPFADLHFPGVLIPRLFLDGTNITLFTIGIILVIGIPLMLLIFAGVKMLFNFKTNNKIIGFSALGVWLVGIIMLITLSFSQVKGYMHGTTKDSKVIPLKTVSSDTLYLKCNDNVFYDYHDVHVSLDNVKILVKDDEEIMIGKPTLDIEKSLSDKFEIKLRKKSRGRTHDKAVSNAEGIEYKWDQIDSVVNFDQYFTLAKDSKWRNQRLHITVKVPEGKVVYLDESMDEIIYNIDNLSNTRDEFMVNQKWIMTKDGLSELK